jgi:hypothetical protein
MKVCHSKLFCGILTAALAVVSTVAEAQSMTIGASRSSNSVVTVRQGINEFANRYGEPVIIHGALNLNAPVSVAFAEGLSSDNAIVALSQAAGAQAVRVYFVTPASSSSKITRGVSAANLVGNAAPINLRLRNVSAAAAITAVASADNAEVRFPDGVPTGMVTLWATTLPLERAISVVASKTKTHWSTGYVMESTNPLLPSLNQYNSSFVGSARAPEGSAVPVSSYSSSSAANNVAATAAGQPEALTIVGGHVVQLPAVKPISRDAMGNSQPFTEQVTATQTPPVPGTSGTTNVASNIPATTTARGVMPLNQGATNDTSQQPSVQTPGLAGTGFGGPISANQDYLGGNFGTVQTFTPNVGPGVSPSGLGFSQAGPDGYIAGNGFATYPEFGY